MINIRYLEILEAIEQTGTFTGAAKKLHITQSAVSHAIAELEQQAETALFDRLPRGVCLTRCGISLLEEARSILTACHNLDKRISRLEECTPINIVSSITIASFLLPPILSRLKNSFPSLKVNVRVESANSAMDILKSGEADICFWEGIEPQGAFRTILLGSYKLCVACAPTFLYLNKPYLYDSYARFRYCYVNKEVLFAILWTVYYLFQTKKLILFGKVLILLHLLKLQKQG